MNSWFTNSSFINGYWELVQGSNDKHHVVRKIYVANWLRLVSGRQIKVFKGLRNDLVCWRWQSMMILKKNLRWVMRMNLSFETFKACSWRLRHTSYSKRQNSFWKPLLDFCSLEKWCILFKHKVALETDYGTAEKSIFKCDLKLAVCR